MTQRFEFVPPGDWPFFWARRLGRDFVACAAIQPLHWLIGVEICGPTFFLALGPVLLGIGRIREVQS